MEPCSRKAPRKLARVNGSPGSLWLQCTPCFGVTGAKRGLVIVVTSGAGIPGTPPNTA